MRCKEGVSKMEGRSNVQRALTAIAVAGAALGCGGSGGSGGSGDGGSGDDDGMQAPPNTVVGKIFNVCHVPSGDIDIPVDETKSIIRAWIPDGGATGYRVSQGTGMADGTFTILDVPDGGEYLLQINGFYTVTDKHVFNSQGERSTRCMPEPVRTTVSTPVRLSLSNATPFSTTSSQVDRLEVDSFSLGIQRTLQSRDVAPGNATTPTTAMFDWVLGPTRVLDAAQGDDLHIFHLRADSDVDPATRGTRTITRLIDHFDATGTTLLPGTPAMIAGAFLPVVANRTATFALDRAAFDASYSGTSEFGQLSVAVTASPPEFSSRGAALANFTFDDERRAPDPVHRITGYAYGDPFPASWKRLVTIRYERFRQFQLPANRLQSTSVGGTFQAFPLAGTIVPAPPLATATAIRVGGADFDQGGKVFFDGQAPIDISWNPVPGARAYTLTVNRITSDVTDFLFLSFRTSGTSLRLPAAAFTGSVLTSGGFYQFELSVTNAPLDGEGPVEPPTQTTIAVSGRFRLSASCGDHSVQTLEEECDTGGESATCNIDCSTPLCGDGVRNAVAGEQCDTGGDTNTCDANCTLAVCGDGHRNATVEDCDDGNAIDDGNGCTVDCKANNACGNGMVENAVEECDPGAAGETAACDSDCTRVFCGDGHVNPAAGEECDEGGRVTTTCTPFCKRQ
jgi:hypothetical protein